MKTLTLYFVRLVALAVFAALTIHSCRAQLSIKGNIYADGIVRATIIDITTHQVFDVYITRQRLTTHNGEKVFKCKYNFPMGFTPNRDYAIMFTDGTVTKSILIYGAVPGNTIPRDRLKIDIDLIGSDADETLVVRWNQSGAFETIPMNQITH